MLPNSLWPMVHKLSTRCPLGSAEIDALLSLPFRLMNARRNSYFAREGERASHCSVLLSGYAMSHRITGEGARQVLSIHFPGDLLDFLNGKADYATSNSEALSSGQVAVIPRAALVDLALEYPWIAIALWTDAGANASILAEWLLNIGRRDARSRIAHLICEIRTRHRASSAPDGGGPSWMLTQEQLADATGLTSVHVNRTLQGLRSEGLLSRERTPQVLDWQRLCEVADFTPDYLQFSELEKPIALEAVH